MPQQAESVFFIDIADIVYSISDEALEGSIYMDEAYRDFYGTGKPEVTIRVHAGKLPQIDWHKLEKIFDSEMVWSLYKNKDQYIFVLNSPALQPSLYSIAFFNQDFSRGDIFCTPPVAGNEDEITQQSPLAYPLAEALMVCLLAQGRGLMMHASGVVDNGRGYLFVGRSTHGKSTMARLWKDKGVVLNDDRIIIRYQDNRFWMYGTPWHGEYNIVSSQKAPLEKIFILSHGAENSTQQISGADAVSMLLTRCFPPFWDRNGMDFTVDFLARMAKAVSCNTLQFKPDKTVIQFVRCVS